MTKEMKTVLAFAGVFVVLAMFALYFVINTMDQVEEKEEGIAKLESDIDKADKEKDKIKPLEEEKSSLENNLKHYVQILPSPDVASEEELMKLVQRNANATNFIITSYSVDKKKLSEQEKKKAAKGKKKKKKKKAGASAEEEAFTEIAVDLDGRGTWQQFLNFLNSIESNPTFLRVNTFQILSGGVVKDEDDKEKWILQCRLNISTFRYEAKAPGKKKGAAKKKPAKKKKKKKK